MIAQSSLTLRTRSYFFCAAFVVGVTFFLAAFATTAHAASLSLSGTLYEADRVTSITTGKTITAAIATTTVSVHSTTTNSGAGTWSITIPDGHTITASTPHHRLC
jgi:hypothetical protein